MTQYQYLGMIIDRKRTFELRVEITEKGGLQCSCEETQAGTGDKQRKQSSEKYTKGIYYQFKDMDPGSE